MPTMKAPDFAQMFYVNLSFGLDVIGAIPVQRGEGSRYTRLVYYANRVKIEVERKYTKAELILSSLVYACRKFRTYLISKPFVVLTSYTLLPQLVNNSMLSRSMMRWLVEL